MILLALHLILLQTVSVCSTDSIEVSFAVNVPYIYVTFLGYDIFVTTIRTQIPMLFTGIEDHHIHDVQINNEGGNIGATIKVDPSTPNIESILYEVRTFVDSGGSIPNDFMYVAAIPGSYREKIPGKADDCFETTSSEYMGTVNRTNSGLTCQRWDVQTPHSHSNNEPALFPDGSVTAAENYCRDPDGEDTPWCYTLNEATRWETCNIPRCKDSTEITSTSTQTVAANTQTDTVQHIINTQAVTTQNQEADDCFETTSSEYMGTVNRTKSGLTCQWWDVQTPHSHSKNEPALFPDGSVTAAENYCRDPDGEDTPWCYTLNEATRWETCNIPRCKDSTEITSTSTQTVAANTQTDTVQHITNTQAVTTQNQAGTTATSLYSDKPVSMPTMSTYIPEDMTTFEDEDKETVVVSVSTYIPDEMTTSDKEDKETIAVTVSTDMPEELTTSDAQDKEIITVPISTYIPNEVTTSDKEDKETVAVPVSTSTPGEITTSDKEDKETITVPVSTYMSDEATTSDIEDKEIVTVPVSTYMSDEVTTSDANDKETVTIPLSTSMPDEIPTSDAKNKETVAVSVSTYQPDEITTSDIEDKETVGVSVSANIPEEMTTSDAQYKETTTVPISTYIPDDVTTSDKETAAVPESTNMSDDITTSDAEDKETVALTVSTYMPDEITTTGKEDKVTVAVPVSTNMPEELTTSDVKYKETVTTARDKDGPTNSTVPSTASIVSTAEPDPFPVTTENYNIQTTGYNESLSGANPLEGPLTAVFFTAMIVRAL